MLFGTEPDSPSIKLLERYAFTNEFDPDAEFLKRCQSDHEEKRRRVVQGTASEDISEEYATAQAAQDLLDEFNKLDDDEKSDLADPNIAGEYELDVEIDSDVGLVVNWGHGGSKTDADDLEDGS